jgi:hypothetical protein
MKTLKLPDAKVKERDEITVLCRELEELGGGIRTRLEGVSCLQLECNSTKLFSRDEHLDQGQYVRTHILKYLDLKYSTSVVTYGAQGSGKSALLFEEQQGLVAKCAQALLSEYQAMLFVEAYELYVDRKSKTEKRRQLITVNQGKRQYAQTSNILDSKIPEFARFQTFEEFT